MKFIELFAGIGGFRLGLERQGHTCVWANEWLEKPSLIYKKNFGNEPNRQDIRTIDPISIPQHELIVGGFPCATFSFAGKRSGFSDVDTRGTLFFEICRIAESKRTPYILLENVKGLLNHEQGKTFGIILYTLDKLGYDIQWELLNSKNFGIPQNRERIFIVANLRGYSRPDVFPITRCQIGANQIRNIGINKIGSIIQKTKKRDILKRLEINQYLRDNLREKSKQEISSLIEIPKTQLDHYFRLDKSSAIPSPEIWIKLKNILNFDNTFDNQVITEYEKYVEFESSRRVYSIDGCSPTLNTSNVPIIKIGDRFRHLTPLECERLQGLPDNWTKWYYGDLLVSDSERYERIGRTVTINIIEEIGKKLK